MTKRVIYSMLSLLFFVVLFVAIVIITDTFCNNDTTFFERNEINQLVEGLGL